MRSWFLAGCLAATACGGVKKGGGGLPTAKLSATAKTVGVPISLDGSGSSAPNGGSLTYTWSIVGAPPGSTAAPEDPAAITTSFVADVSGTYRVRLVVADSTGALGAAFASLDVTQPDVFYTAYDVISGKSTVTPHVVKADGTGDHAIGCPSSFPKGSEVMDDGSPAAFVFDVSFATSRATADGRFLFPNLMPAPTLYTGTLWLADAGGDCATQPATQVDKNAASLLSGNSMAVLPRLSPNGKRIAYVALYTDTEASDLVTVNTDGTDPRKVTSLSSFERVPVAPVWVDDTHLAWVEVDTSGQQTASFHESSDASGASSTNIHDCGTTFRVISQFDFLPNDKIIFTGGTMEAQNGGATNLYVQTLGTCTASGALTDGTASHFAGDFDLSADKTKAVFVWDRDGGTYAGNTLPTDVFTIPLDGSNPATKIYGDSTSENFGPHYLPGSAQIAWTQLKLPTSGLPPTSSVLVANGDGSSVKSVVVTTNVAGEYHGAVTGANVSGACSAAPGRPVGASWPVLLFATACIGRAARRSSLRRRRANS